MVGEKFGLTKDTCFGKYSIHYAYSVSPLNVLRFDSTVVINVVINISSPKLNNQFFLNFEAECINMLLG